MHVRSLLFSAALVVATAPATAAGTPQIGTLDPAACMEGDKAQFGRYVGDWKIVDQSFKRDGSGWEPGKGARWIFHCVGDGVAVQDYWLPNGGGFGTNLRTFNPDTGSWEIVWAAGRQKGLMQIRATANEAGDVVMDIVAPEQNPPRRIIFRKPDAKGWNWVQEWSMDGGESWIEVYRIRATPWDAKPDD